MARARGALAGALLLAAALPAMGQSRLFESEYDDEKKPWAEIEAQLPPAPRPENLIQFDGGGATAHRFYIDAPSVSAGADGVVRYTMVVRTGGGSTNVSYEGIRCETQQQKLYAIGHSDGKWVRARDPQWRRIESQQLNRHHSILYLEVFCPDRHARMVPVKQMLESLKRASVGLR